MITIDQLKQDYDWQSAFAEAMSRPPGTTEGYSGSLATFTIDDVAEVLAYADGENDGAEWVGAFHLSDGRYALLAAGCDYTGWDCQASGYASVAATRSALIRWGMTAEQRERLGYSLDGDNE